MMGSGGRRQLIIWKDRLNGTCFLEVRIHCRHDNVGSGLLGKTVTLIGQLDIVSSSRACVLSGCIKWNCLDAPTQAHLFALLLPSAPPLLDPKYPVG